MLIDLLDVLRCPEAHEDTWLVGAFDAMEGRDVVRGTLGCPVCRAEYPVRDRMVHFGGSAAARAAVARLGEGDEDAPARLGAMLALFGGGGVVVLGGAWGQAGRALANLVEDVQVVLVNPPSRVPIGHGVSALLVGDRLPLATGACRGIALDDVTASPELVASAVRSLRARGRLVAPVATPLPEEVVELVRDDRVWVGERQALAATRPVGLSRARPAGDRPAGG